MAGHCSHWNSAERYSRRPRVSERSLKWLSRLINLQRHRTARALAALLQGGTANSSVGSSPASSADRGRVAAGVWDIWRACIVETEKEHEDRGEK